MDKLSSDKQIRLGAVLSYVTIVLSVLSGFIYTPWMIKCIGQNDYGLFTLANSLISLFTVDFGLSNAVSRFLSVYYSKNEEDKANNMLGLVYKLYLIIDLVLFVVLLVIFFLLENIYSNFTAEEITKLKFIFLILGAYTLINFPFVTLNGILNAREKFVQLKITDIINRLLIVGLMILFLVLGYGLYAVVLVNAGVGIFIILLKLIIIGKNKLARPNLKYFNGALLKEIFGFSIWVTVTLLAQRLIFSIVPSILGITLGTAAVAVFGIASTMECYAYSIANAINGFFMPSVAKIYAADENADIQPLMTKVGRYQFSVFGLIFGGFLVLGQSFIQLWVGIDYSDAYYILVLILFAELFESAYSVGNTALTVKNKVKEQAIIALTAGIINVVFVFILTYLFGVIGSGVSIAIARFVSFIITTIVFIKILHVRPHVFAKDVYLRHGIPLIAVIIEGFILTQMIGCDTWIKFILLTAIISLSYIFLLFLFALSIEEKKKILQLVKKRKDT